MTDDIDVRKRRAIYRAGHRGMKELDILLSKYANARVSKMNEHELSQFEALLDLQEPQLYEWLVTLEEPIGNDVPKMVDEVRAFHGF